MEPDPLILNCPSTTGDCPKVLLRTWLYILYGKIHLWTDLTDKVAVKTLLGTFSKMTAKHILDTIKAV